MEQKTYTQEQYNDLEVELGVLYATNEKNFETYQEALTKINKLELQSKKMLEILNWFANEFDDVFHEGTETNDIVLKAKQLVKEITEI
jgi:hypothetical protein